MGVIAINQYMKEGDIIEVSVTEVNPGYILIEYNEKPATLQVIDLTWKPGRVNPKDFVSVGDHVKVKVTKVIGEKYSVSLREALPNGNPWNKPPKIGERFQGKVSVVTDYGYFFDITEYCRALLHKDDATKTYKIGEPEILIVKSIEIKLRKVELSVAN